MALAPIDLNTIAAGTGGFVIFGQETFDLSGFSVHSGGDINGDGFDDLIIGAPLGDAAGNATNAAGDTFVVFGKAGPFGSSVDLTDIAAGTGGFVIFGQDVPDRTGWSVASTGDINGDGFDDLIIGTWAADAAGNAKSYSGEAYVVFGRAAGFGAALDLTDVAAGTGGFALYGQDMEDRAGYSVASAGDINGDGFDDLIIGAYLADAAGNAKASAGDSYLVFGNATGFGASIDLTDVAGGTGGFVIFGQDANDRSGRSVASAGDVNGDGYDDVLVSAVWADGAGNAATEVGETYVLFGRASTFGTSVNLSDVASGSGGFVIYGQDIGDRSGVSVASAGDFNGDGFDDVIIGAYMADGAGDSRASAGETYVVFGRAAGFGASVELAAIANGTGGFVIFGQDAGDYSGRVISSAGDVNGDGLDDIIIGVRLADNAGNSKSNAGDTYVVFGRTAGFGANVDLADIAAGTGGFVLFGRDTSDASGVSVASAGDVNGDGFDDLLIGALGGDGPANSRPEAGESYVVFGRDFTATVTHLGTTTAETLTGNGAADMIVAGQGDDILNGKGGVDVLLGGAGNDTIRVSDFSFRRVDGGSGIDTLALEGKGLTLELSAIANSRLRGIERIDLTGSGNNSLVLTALEVLNLSDSSNALQVDGNAGDGVLFAGQAWVQGATSGGYTAYTLGQASVLIGSAITILADTSPSVPDMSAGSDSGASSTDNITRITTPTFTGSAGANATVTLFDGATIIGTGKASAGGAWSIKTSALSHGLHLITAQATSPGSFPSASSGSLAVTIDTTAPVAPTAPDLVVASDTGVSGTDNITKDTTPTLTGTAEALSTITIMDGATVIGTGKANGAGTWSVTTSVLTPGVHLIRAKATDLAGNVGANSGALTVTIDTTIATPAAPDLADASDKGASATDNITSVTTPIFNGIAEANATVTLLDGNVIVGTGKASVAGNWSIKASTLAHGAHAMTVKVTDVAGNASAPSAVLNVTIDTTAPLASTTPNLATASDSGRLVADNITNVKTPVFNGTAEAGATVTLSAGGTTLGSAKVGNAGNWSITSSPLADGKYAVVARVMDPAGNNSAFSAALPVTIDNAAPSAPAISTVTTAAITGSTEPYAQVKLFSGANEIGSAIAQANGGWSMPLVLPPGTHVLTARATDQAGNTGVASGTVSAVIGSAASDVLMGTAGPDLMAGGGGNDTYHVNHPGDVVTEGVGGGTDTILATVDHTLGATLQIEFLQAAAGAPGLDLTGNGLANTITGGDGDDVITGGGGSDLLMGGLGADIFTLLALADSKVVAAGRDTIGDFSAIAGDLIGLSALDANTGLGGNQAFVFIGAAAFSGAGQVRAEVVGGNTIVSGNVNAALGADFAITLTGSHSLTGAHFIL